MPSCQPATYSRRWSMPSNIFRSDTDLTPTGAWGRAVKELNTPLSARVEQLRLTLERWRWLPHEFPQPPVVVNVPEFRLRAFDANGKLALSSNVIVGKALRHEHPGVRPRDAVRGVSPVLERAAEHPAQRDRARDHA